MIIKKKISDIIEYDKNTKAHPQKQIDKIAKSISEFGFNVPIIIDGNNVIITGHGRYKSAKKLKLKSVPCIIKKDLTESQIKAYRIMDNKSAESDWIDDVLKSELIDLQDDNFNLELTGFSINELNDILECQNKELIDDTVEVDTYLRRKSKYKIKQGEIYQLGEHRLMCGNATSEEDVNKIMGGNKADMVFTDPPYSVNYSKKENEILGNKEYNKITNDDMNVEQISKEVWSPAFKNMYNNSNDLCSFYVTMPQGGDQMMMMKEHWQVKHELIWLKENATFSMGRLDYDYKHEPIMYGWKKKHKFYGNGEFTNSIWQIERNKDKKVHPTMKPIALISNALKNSSKEKDIVLDLFGGSGSTLIVAEQLNRKGYIMEIDTHYCSVIIERWENLTKQKAEKI